MKLRRQAYFPRRLPDWRELFCSAPFGELVSRVFADRIPSHGVRIGTNHPDVRPETKAAIFWRLYERAELKLARLELRKDLTVVELGSSIGVMGSHVRPRLEAGCRYVAVEANPKLLDLLRENLGEPGENDALVIVNAAIVGEEAPNVLLEIGRETTAGRIADLDQAAQVELGDHASVRVPAIRLSDLLGRNNIGNYTLISDIEGAEAAVLLEDATSLARCQQLLIELHSTQDSEGRVLRPEDLCKIIEGLGFTEMQRRGNVLLYER